MSRYIDAEFEIKHYISMTTHPTPDVSEKDKRDSLIILEALQRAKSIDIVRCGECKYCNEDKCWNLKGLNKIDGAVKADDFCSYGERIEE